MSAVEGRTLLAGGDDQPASSPETAPTPSQSAPQFHQNGINIVPDRRRHQRVRIPLRGRFMRADEQEYACQVMNISAGGIALLAPVAGEIGERIVVYLDDLGRFEGELVRHFQGGFAVKLAGTAYKREKIVDQLTWLLNRDRLALAEERAHERFTPVKQRISLTLADDTQRQARLLDVSLGGASVRVRPKPPVGEPVTLGLIRGTVVRHHEHGIGIRFHEIQDPTTIERYFG